MNNSKIVSDNFEESKEDNSQIFEVKQGKLSQIIEAINGVEASEDWRKLKKLLLDGIVSNLERQLLNEVSRKEINPSEIYRLQGQLTWAKRYADLKKLAESKKRELEGIKLSQKVWKHQNNEQ